MGETVYFMGLLEHIDSMAERSIPMMRGGVLGAVYQEQIPVRDSLRDRMEYTRMEPVAHLVDCYSRSGFSGSPVLMEMPTIDVHHEPGGDISLGMSGKVSLIGVLVGHFGSPGDNAGIAIVVPIERVRQVIEESEELRQLASDEEHCSRRNRGRSLRMILVWPT